MHETTYELGHPSRDPINGMFQGHVEGGEENGSFEVGVGPKASEVTRRFVFAEGSVDFVVRVPPTGVQADMTLRDLHEQSLRIAIAHLQRMLDESTTR